MRLANYARLVMLLFLSVPVGGVCLMAMPRPGPAAVLIAVAAWGALFAWVFVVAVALHRVRCPFCDRRGRLGPPPNKGRRYTAFLCPDCGWIDSKGIFRTMFFRMEERAAGGTKKLELEDGRIWQDPSRNDVAKALASLGMKGNSFAILGKDQMNYLQASGNPTDGFDLEYQEGSRDKHFRAVDRSMSLRQIVEAFQDYNEDGQTWKGSIRWEAVEV